LSSIFERLKNFFIREKAKGIVVPSFWGRIGEPSEPNLTDFEDYYKSDPIVRQAIDMLAEMVAGNGYYTTCEDEKSKEIVDNFAEQVGMDQLLLNIVRNMLVYGDAYVEKIFKGRKIIGLQLLPPTTMKVVRTEHGKLLGYKQSSYGKKISFKPNQIVHFKHSPLGSSAYGISIIKPVFSYLEIKKKWNEDMKKILERHARPPIVWIAPNKAARENLLTILRDKQPDEDIAITGEIEPKVIDIDPRLPYKDFIDYLNIQIWEGLGAPLLSYLRNATEASANVMLEAVERHVAGIQRYVKRKVEAEIFRPIIEVEGLREVPRLNWGFPKTKLEDFNVDELGKLIDVLTKAGYIGKATVLQWLKTFGLPIEEEDFKGEKNE